MPQATFPDPGPDDAEPDGFPLDEDAPGPEQGLYITLPAEHLTLAGFNQGGAADTMAPGPLLATVVHTVTGEDGSGLAGCSDDQLMGIISAARRQQSRDEWTVMAAIAEFARRAGTGVEGEFAADELASELHMSQQSAAGQMDFATEVAKRLPKTFAALAAGQIHPIHLRIIEDETRFLTDADAAQADAILAGAAPGRRSASSATPPASWSSSSTPTPPASARKPPGARPTSAGSARSPATPGWSPASCPPTRSWRPGSTSSSAPWTCAPPASPAPCRTSASAPTSICSKNATAAPPPPAPKAPPAAGKPARTSLPRTSLPRTPTRLAPATAPQALTDPVALTDPAAPTDPAAVPAARAAPAPFPAPARAPGRALVTITIPLTTCQGRSEAPGEADGYGLLDGDDARDLATVRKSRRSSSAPSMPSGGR